MSGRPVVKPIQDLQHLPCRHQLSLPYISTDCATALYIIPRDHTIAPAFIINLEIIPHSLRDFWDLIWLVNSPSTLCRLGYHGV